MEVSHDDSTTRRLEAEKDFNGGFSEAEEIVKSFRKKMQAIRSAIDERDFAAFRSWRFEKLKGKRSHQYSIRLNSQWRLILEFTPGPTGNVVVVKGIEDYH